MLTIKKLHAKLWYPANVWLVSFTRSLTGEYHEKRYAIRRQNHPGTDQAKALGMQTAMGRKIVHAGRFEKFAGNVFGAWH